MSGWAALAAAAAFGAGWVLGAPRPRVAQQRLPPALLGAALALPAVARALAAAREREEAAACLAGLPELFDILALGLSAGLSFDGALDLYLEGRQGALASAVGEARLSWALGLTGRAEALAALADRLDLVPLRRFADAVGEALEFGVPLAATLERQSAAMRRDQRLQMEEAVERVPVKLLLPLGGLVVPAMLLAVLGPLMAQALASLG